MEGKKVVRRISTRTYIAAFIITMLVFSLGIYVGMLIDEQAQGEVESGISELERDLYLSRILMLAEGEIGDFCPIYEEKLGAVNSERELIGERLEYLESVRGVYDWELKEKYFYLEFENYLLIKRMKEQCGGNQTLILFFYGSGEDSLEQGRVLDGLRAQDGSVKVFSFDGARESVVVEVLKGMYNVSSYPSVVVDGKTLSGLSEEAEIEGIRGNATMGEGG
jgi:hypothetical protein